MSENLAAAFTAGRWQQPEAPEIELRLGPDLPAPGEALELAHECLRRTCESFGVPEVELDWHFDESLGSGEFEVVVDGATRIADAHPAPPLAWRGAHPAAGPRGRSGLLPLSDPGSDFATHVAGSVEEAVFDDPSLLLPQHRVSALVDSYVWAEGLPELLPALARRRIRLDVPAVATFLSARDAEAAGDVVEQASSALRSLELTISLGPGFEETPQPDVESVLGTLHATLGVGFPAPEVVPLQPSLTDKEFEISVCGIRRAGGSIPSEQFIITLPPQSTNGRGEPWIDPVTGAVGTLLGLDDVLELELGDYAHLPLWSLERHLEAVLREAAAEFTDLAWIRQQVAQVEPGYSNLVRTVTAIHGEDALTTILSSLVAEGVSIRDLPRILNRLAEYGSAPAAASIVLDDEPPGRSTGAASVAEFARAGLRDWISYRHADNWTLAEPGSFVTGYMPTIELGEELVTTFRARLDEVDDVTPRIPEAGSILRAVRQALGEMHVAQTRLVVPADVRRSMRRLLAAQFPTLPVLATSEIQPGIERVPLATASAAH